MTSASRTINSHLHAVPRLDRRTRPRVELDTSFPVMLMRIPGYPVHHGGVGVIRTLGRAGVPVYAVVESRVAPAALSRYLTRGFVWPVGEKDPARVLERLVDLGVELARTSAPPLIVCTDDDAAMLVAEHADALRDHFVLPPVPSGLPRQLADKSECYQLCLTHGMAAPTTLRARTKKELEESVSQLGLPVVVKSTALWPRPFQMALEHSFMVESEKQLSDLLEALAESFDAIVQQKIPDEVAEDWIVHGYCDSQSKALVLFTGRKLGSWPPRVGLTTRARVETNPKLASKVEGLVSEVGYCGVFDLDCRLDRRTGEYNLLDFNPRVGAQFRMFENDAGIDVVRAMHLDMSGRTLPPGHPVEGEEFVVENLELARRFAEAGTTRRVPAATNDRRPRLAWAAADDPVPALSMLVAQSVWSASIRLLHRSPRWFRTRNDP